MMNEYLKKIGSKVKVYWVFLIILLVTACGGGSSGGDDPGTGGELIGTGMRGTAATGEAIANAPIRIKSQSGVVVTATTDTQGKFLTSEIKETSANTQRGPYLLQIDQGNGEYLYSIAHVINAETIDADSAEISINIHPFTDLIIRNWFAQNNVDIDSAITGTDVIDELPSAAEIESIRDEFLNILTRVLGENGASIEADLLAEEFDADQTGFDQFLDNSQVTINNNIINVVINQPNVVNGIQNNIILDVPLDYDFTTVNDSPPSLPTEVRVLPTDQDNEAIIVWAPAADDKGIPYYVIYRDGIEIGSTPYPVFFDATPEQGIVYSYTVEAIDSAGQGSGQTNGVEIELDVPDTTPPPPASNVQLSEVNGVVSLVWNITGIDDVAGFRIYRDAQGAVSVTQDDFIAAVTSNTFDDFNVMAGTEYCYLIVTYDAAELTAPPTTEACISVSGVSPGPSEVAFSSATYTAVESVGSISVAVSRTGDISQAISVDYSVLADSATADIDFTEAAGTLNWAVNDISDKTIAIQLYENAAPESDETVLLELSNPSQFTGLGNISSATLTITDAPQVSCIDLSPTTITVDTTLSEPCYNVNSNVAIRNAATLTINPGVRLQFALDVNVVVEGDGILSAVGTSASPIVFTGSIPTQGYWDGIDIRSVATSQIDYAIVEYGGSISSFNQANVGVSFSGRLSLSNSILRHSATHGVSISNGVNGLANFSNNIVTLNEDTPVSIRPNQVGALAANNSFTGNMTAAGANRDYIEIGNGSGSFGIYSDQTWNALDVDYRIYPGLPTNVTAELTLAPGATLVFDADAFLGIHDGGALRAIGTELEPITFTGLQQVPGFWSGIQFMTNTANNVLDHTVVEYGGGTRANIRANVGVYDADSQLTIRNTTLRHSEEYGFQFANGIALDMSNVTSTSNNRPGSIWFVDIGILDGSSVYSGNTDDRLFLIGPGLSGDFTDQTVKNIGIPYYDSNASGLTSVQAQLTLDPGVEMEFNSNGGLNIQGDGALIAQGTVSEPIIFTGAQKVSGYWNGIQLATSNANIIDNAIVEYGGANTGNTAGLIGLYGIDGSTITNSTLRSSATNGIDIAPGTTGETINAINFEAIDGDDILDRR